MENRARLFGHAIHSILIVFPSGLLATGIVFNIIYLMAGDPTCSNGLASALTTGKSQRAQFAFCLLNTTRRNNTEAHTLVGAKLIMEV